MSAVAVTSWIGDGVATASAFRPAFAGLAGLTWSCLGDTPGTTLKAKGGQARILTVDGATDQASIGVKAAQLEKDYPAPVVVDGGTKPK